jgi:hypothetical protein
MLIRKLSAAAAALSLCGLAAPVSSALAATTPPAYAPPAGLPLPLLTFVPPSVGPLSVSIGATILGGRVISPGVNVTTAGVSLPPLAWAPPH